MSRRDGTGQMRHGAMTGRGFGRYYADELYSMTDKEILEEQKELLKRRLDAVNRQLDTFQD